jgi:hypothetical protein
MHACASIADRDHTASDDFIMAVLAANQHAYKRKLDVHIDSMVVESRFGSFEPTPTTLVYNLQDIYEG